MNKKKICPLKKQILNLTFIMTKRVFLSFILILFFFAGCKQRPCNTTNCDNAGIVTFDGGDCYCDCPLSTRGVNCQINLMDSLAGVYTLDDRCQSGNSISTENLIRTDSNYFDLKSLGNMPNPANTCPIRIKILIDKAIIDSQFVCNDANVTDGYLIYGDGKVDYVLHTLTINYYITHLMGASNQIDTCAVYFTK
jgi:hypothetical protein